MSEPLTVSVVEGAALLGVGRGAMYRAVKAGVFRVLRMGRKVRIPRAELERLMQEPERFRREAPRPEVRRPRRRRPKR